MKPGVELLSEEIGTGELVLKHATYQVKFRMWLSRGDPVRWTKPWGLLTGARIEDDGATLISGVRIDRVFLFAGLFYGIQGMRVGGTRTLRIAPHLAYGAEGLPGTIPPNALLKVEVSVLAERAASGLPPSA